MNPLESMNQLKKDSQQVIMKELEWRVLITRKPELVDVL